MNSSPINRPEKIAPVGTTNRSSRRSANRSASSHHGRSGLAPIICALVLVIALVGASCSSGKPKAAPVPDSTTTTTTLSPYVTTIANVKGRTIEVLENDPTGASSTTTADPNAPASTLPPIPRSSLNSAGVKKTDAGFEFSNPTYFRNPLVFDVIE